MKLEIENPTQELIDRVESRRIALGFSTVSDYLTYLVLVGNKTVNRTLDSKALTTDKIVSMWDSKLTKEFLYKNFTVGKAYTSSEIVDTITKGLLLDLPTFATLKVGLRRTVAKRIVTHPVLKECFDRNNELLKIRNVNNMFYLKPLEK